MRISVTDPIDRAWNRMVRVLFKPFEIGKWFGLGLCVFLSNLGRGGGGNFNFNIPTGGGGPAPQPPGTPGPGGQTQTAQQINAFIQWIKVNLPMVIVLGLLSVLLFTLLWALILWLRSRGVFMTIDGLVHNRGSIKEPWRNYRGRGNSLFRFSMLMWGLATVISLATLIGAGVIAWPDILNETFGERAIWALILMVVVMPLTIVNYAIIEMVLIDFIAPTMYVHDLNVTEAWKLWWREVFRGHFWLHVLFYLMKIVLGIATAIVAMLAMCLTCCIAWLPYIGTVILLPVFVFMRCYSLYFLEQFGEPWRMFISEGDELLCVSCGYDLRGNPGALTCPECGSLTPTGSRYVQPPPPA